MWIPVEPLNFNVEASTRDLHDHGQDQSGSNEPSDMLHLNMTSFSSSFVTMDHLFPPAEEKSVG